MPTTRGDGPPWMPVSCTTACPFPRAISQRLTGSAKNPAITSATASDPQNSRSPSPAWSAPGMATTIRLSTISMTPIESVSEASAIGTTAANAMPARSSGRLVSE